MGAPIDLTGQSFGRLKVVALADSLRHPCGDVSRRWTCICECGQTAIVIAKALRRGVTTSCGCLQRERASTANTRHGQTVSGRSGAYRTWQAMLTRCTNPNQRSYRDYGGRGIDVCERWLGSFEAFFADMGERPAGLTIDRIDNARGYDPGNCRWATRVEQQRNSRATKFVTVDGTSDTLAGWAERTGIPATAIRARIARGWSAMRAVSTPLKTTQGR